MSAKKKDPFRVGAKVKVPWDLKGPLDGEIVEVWGDAAGHVKVRFRIDGAEDFTVRLATTDLLTPA